MPKPRRLYSLLPLLLLACLSGCLAGCQTLDATRTSPTAIQAAKIAVQYGTMRYIGSRPEAERVAKALRVREVVLQVEALAKGEAVTLSLLEGEIRKLLPADLKPEDLFAINSLLELVMMELRARVGDGVLNENQLLQVSLVAGWVVDATRFYSA